MGHRQSRGSTGWPEELDVEEPDGPLLVPARPGGVAADAPALRDLPALLRLAGRGVVLPHVRRRGYPTAIQRRRRSRGLAVLPAAGSVAGGVAVAGALMTGAVPGWAAGPGRSLAGAPARRRCPSAPSRADGPPSRRAPGGRPVAAGSKPSPGTAPPRAGSPAPAAPVQQPGPRRRDRAPPPAAVPAGPPDGRAAGATAGRLARRRPSRPATATAQPATCARHPSRRRHRPRRRGPRTRGR